MKPHARTILACGGVLAICAVLAVFWSHACARSAELDAEIARLRAPTDGGSEHRSTAEPVDTVEASPPADPELEARQHLLTDARAIPELARREATLVAIRQIKARHAAAPPPPRALPPPLGTRYGPYFTELFSDPEYLVLVRKDWQSNRGESSIRRLAALDLPETTKRQVEDIEFESYLSLVETAANATSVSTLEERRALMQVRKRMDEERQLRLRQALGDDYFRHYSSPSTSASTASLSASGGTATAVAVSGPAGLTMQESVSYSPLATRLSYSSSPLTEADATRLQNLLDAMATPQTPAYRLWYDVEFFNQAQAILSPTQLDALRQLQEEYEAGQLRSRLPKSSELPRTTRRARLEGGR